MVVIGTDSHKRTHTVVAVDVNGRKLAEKTLPATSDGHLGLIRWARRWRERCFALEDCRHLTRRLEADLLRASERVVRVPPKLMAGARRSTREPGKSDPIDALSVARAALRERDLPIARLDGAEREVRLLVDHRPRSSGSGRGSSRACAGSSSSSPSASRALARSPRRTCSPVSSATSPAAPSRVPG